MIHTHGACTRSCEWSGRGRAQPAGRKRACMSVHACVSGASMLAPGRCRQGTTEPHARAARSAWPHLQACAPTHGRSLPELSARMVWHKVTWQKNMRAGLVPARCQPVPAVLCQLAPRQL
eukprot:11963-Chlamydomonas_euryale.AAC.4